MSSRFEKILPGEGTQDTIGRGASCTGLPWVSGVLQLYGEKVVRRLEGATTNPAHQWQRYNPQQGGGWHYPRVPRRSPHGRLGWPTDQGVRGWGTPQGRIALRDAATQRPAGRTAAAAGGGSALPGPHPEFHESSFARVLRVLGVEALL